MGNFDLNIDTILEHWTKTHALRELIANALDEHTITKNKKDIDIKFDNKKVIITDYGRGIEAKHLIQNENPEKISNDKLIGKFGIGLKDAVATLQRHGCSITIESKNCKITFIMLGKNGFDKIKTLHASIDEKKKILTGTKITINNIDEADVDNAKKYFLLFNKLEKLDENKFGEIYKKTGTEPSYICINGVKVGEEENFKYHYNIINLTKKIRDALNRERNNVGKQVYSDRVKQILTNNKSQIIIDELITEYTNNDNGNSCDEISYSEVAQYIIKHQNVDDNCVYMTKTQMESMYSTIDEIKIENKKIILVPDNVYQQIQKNTDIKGTNIMTCEYFLSEQAKKFEYKFVDINKLTLKEKEVYNRTPEILKLAGITHNFPLKISETMSIKENGITLGCFDDGEIIIKRSELCNLKDYSGTLIHEYIHGIHKNGDVTREFENDLTNQIGIIVDNVLKENFKQNIENDGKKVIQKQKKIKNKGDIK